MIPVYCIFEPNLLHCQLFICLQLVQEFNIDVIRLYLINTFKKVLMIILLL